MAIYTFKTFDFSNQSTTIEAPAITVCPLCKKSIDSTQNITSHKFFNSPNNEHIKEFYVLHCHCPNCEETFIIELGYKLDEICLLNGNYIVTYCGKKRYAIDYNNDFISRMSPNLSTILYQSQIAEYENLSYITGTSYRKALEFLVKDYLIYKNPQLKENIANTQLHKCITDIAKNLDNTKFAAVSKLATLAKDLGNSETHYNKTIDTKDNISLMKTSINLLIDYFIAIENAQSHEDIIQNRIQSTQC